MIKLRVYVTILTYCDDVIYDNFFPTLYKMQIKHNHKSNRIVSKSAKGGKLKSNTLLKFVCTDKSERTFVK